MLCLHSLTNTGSLNWSAAAAKSGAGEAASYENQISHVKNCLVSMALCFLHGQFATGHMLLGQKKQRLGINTKEPQLWHF